MKTNSTRIPAEDLPVTTVKALKPGTYFKLSPSSKAVYIRGSYDRAQKKYECQKFDDISACSYFKGDRAAYVDFTF